MVIAIILTGESYIMSATVKEGMEKKVLGQVGRGENYISPASIIDKEPRKGNLVTRGLLGGKIVIVDTGQ